MDRNEVDPRGLELVGQAVMAGAESLHPERKRAVRERVMSHVAGDAVRIRSLFVFRRAVATVTVTATLLGGVSYAAASSLPGDPLYGIKRLSEDVTLQVLPEGALQRRFLFTIATRRADELAQMTTDGADDALKIRTLEQFQATTSAAYGDGTSSDAPYASETRMREHVETAPQPARTQLQQALDEAGSGAAGQPTSGVGQQGPESEDTYGSPGAAGNPSTSTEPTGPAGTGRP